MKGVSTIVSIILILMMTVALAALLYFWLTLVYGQITETGTQQIESSTQHITTSFSIESVRNVSSTNLSISIRNTGTSMINVANVETYIDDIRVTESYGKTGSLTANDVKNTSRALYPRNQKKIANRK